jgi:hypothetical protein
MLHAALAARSIQRALKVVTKILHAAVAMEDGAVASAATKIRQAP